MRSPPSAPSSTSYPSIAMGLFSSIETLGMADETVEM
jgi:hypothetical protein